ncbi:MAG: hypothetical protein R3D68_12445 [Hyphomicrobiaceae bacterium]
MRTARVFFACLLLMLGLGATPLSAARDDSVPAQGPRLEFLVLEVRNCVVCDLVRQNIRPLYESSTPSRAVPMRFVDITRIDERGLGLSSPVQTLPTIVLMREGQEVDRMTGYMAPGVMLRQMSLMITSQPE